MDSRRETSSVTTRTVLGYVHERGGDEAVQAVLAAAALPDSLEQLQDVSHWVTYDSRIRLFEATAAHFDDPRAMYEAGRSSMLRGVAPSVNLAMRSLGSPAEIYPLVPGTIGKYSTVSTMELLRSTPTSATFRFSLHDGYRHSRHDCLYAQGLLAAIPEVFDLPPAGIVHEACEADGAPACVYDLTWVDAAQAIAGQGTTALERENAALRRQLADMRSATADLVSGHDLADVLQRVVERAAAAVLARGYLLVVRGQDGEPQVHSHGLGRAEVQPAAAALLAGRPVGADSLVVDVASTRQQHGWLAALDAQPIPGDREALRSYARHAAAALDLVAALDASRREAARAGALLSLAHRLADTDSAQQVADVVAETLTAAVGCASASVMLWDPQDELLRSVGHAGKSTAAAEALRSIAVSPADVPELAELMHHPQPRINSVDTASPALAALMRATEVEHLLVAPVRSAGRFYGVLTGSWRALPPGGGTESDLMQRLRGVADQAATALRNAQLTTDVRHQAEHDDLTGLPNRRLLLRRLQEVLTAGTGWTGVLFCDLDGFKGVNDRHGHAAGDELLRQVAGRISATLRADDEVGRLSGDEFATVLPGLADPGEAHQIAQRLVEVLRTPFVVQGRTLRVTASVGLALHSGAGGEAGRLLHDADTAMYAAKQRGRDQVGRIAAPRSASAPAPALW